MAHCALVPKVPWAARQLRGDSSRRCASSTAYAAGPGDTTPVPAVEEATSFRTPEETAGFEWRWEPVWCPADALSGVWGAFRIIWQSVEPLSPGTTLSGAAAAAASLSRPRCSVDATTRCRLARRVGVGLPARTGWLVV